MEIKVRAFEFGDVPKLSRILKKMEIKDELKKLFSMPGVKAKDTEKEKKEKERNAEEMGAEFGATVVINLCMAENEIFELIASLTGFTIDGVKTMKLDEMMKLFTEFGKSAGNLVSFFKSAAK